MTCENGTHWAFSETWQKAGLNVREGGTTGGRQTLSRGSKGADREELSVVQYEHGCHTCCTVSPFLTQISKITVGTHE